MTIAAQDLERIKRELSGIREFYDARIDKEIPPLREEMDRITGQLNRVQELWRDGEKRALHPATAAPNGLGWRSENTWD